jgi:hypothetical protein
VPQWDFSPKYSKYFDYGCEFSVLVLISRYTESLAFYKSNINIKRHTKSFSTTVENLCSPKGWTSIMSPLKLFTECRMLRRKCGTKREKINRG